MDVALEKASTSRYVVEATPILAGKIGCPPCTPKKAATETVQELKNKATKHVDNIKKTLGDSVKTIQTNVDARARAAHGAISATTAKAHSATTAAAQQVKDVADKVGTALGTKPAEVSSDIASIAQHMKSTGVNTIGSSLPTVPRSTSSPNIAKPLKTTVVKPNIIDDIVNTITGKSGGRRSRRRRRRRNKRTRRKKPRKKRKTRYRRKRQRRRRTKRY